MDYSKSFTLQNYCSKGCFLYVQFGEKKKNSKFEDKLPIKSTELQKRSFHVVVRSRMPAKCTKPKKRLSTV